MEWSRHGVGKGPDHPVFRNRRGKFFEGHVLDGQSHGFLLMGHAQKVIQGHDPLDGVPKKPKQPTAVMRIKQLGSLPHMRRQHHIDHPRGNQTQLSSTLQTQRSRSVDIGKIAKGLLQQLQLLTKQQQQQQQQTKEKGPTTTTTTATRTT